MKNILLYLKWYEARTHAGLLRYSQEHNWILHANAQSAEALSNISVDGAVISPGSNEKIITRLQEQKSPFVLVYDDQNLKVGAPCVALDNKAMGKMAAEFFIERQFRNFATFFPHPFQPQAHFQSRIDAFSEEVNKVGGNLFSVYRPHRKGKLPQLREDQEKIKFYKKELKKLPLPLAVFILTDNDATFFQMACIDLELSIPEDVAIISVNNDPMIAPYTPYPLSSINPGWENMGYLAGSLLHRMMDGEQVATITRFMPPVGVVERLSSSIVAVDDPRVSDAVSYIWQNLEKDPSVDDVCEAIGESRKNLTRAFSKHLGRGIKQEVQLARIRKIKSLLLESDMSSVAISRKLHFTSEYYMYNFFKKYTGMTTKEFREQAKSDN